MKLRDYQQDAVDAFWRDAAKSPSTRQLLHLPTGAGKSLVIASIAAKAVEKGLKVLVLARTKELLVQNNERYCQYTRDPRSAGVYSAGLGMRDTDEPVIFAGVQSLVKAADLVGQRHLVIVDEAHQIPQDESSQYQKILDYFRRTYGVGKLLGLTASPYRLDGGVIFGGRDSQFDILSYSCPLGKLFDDGYLTRPETLPVEPVSMEGVKTSAGDFNKADMQTRFLGRSITKEIVDAANSKGMKSILVFCSGVAHAELLKAELEQHGENCRLVTGMTLPLMREAHLRSFDDGAVRWLINVDVLTTGYDCTRVDGIVVARATQSPGLFYQIVGRGFRLHPGKESCHIIDYGGNIDRHGPVDSSEYGINTIKPPSTGQNEPPKRVCPKCFTVQFAGNKTCDKCGLEFPAREKEAAVASKKSITIKPTQHQVAETYYKRNKGRDGKKDTLLVRYRLHVSDSEDLVGGAKRWATEWICIEHEGWARSKAAQWWNARSNMQCPETIDECLLLIDDGAMAEVKEITLKRDGKWDRIVDYRIGEKPPAWEIDFDSMDDDCPF